MALDWTPTGRCRAFKNPPGEERGCHGHLSETPALAPKLLPVLHRWRGRCCRRLADDVVAGGIEQPLPYRLLVIAGAIYVIVRHRANIQRLLAGTEPRLGRSGPDTKAEAQV